MTWLTRTPLAVVRACVAMMPRLRAEESIEMVERVAVGTGSYKPRDAEMKMRAWKRTVAGERERARPVNPAALAAMGISYQVVPPAPPEDGT